MSSVCGEKSLSELVQHISTSKENESKMAESFYQGLRTCLNNPEKTYKEKIYALGIAWEALASSNNQSSPVIRYLYRDTVMLVLQSEWGKLKKVTKRHLEVTLQNAVANLFNTHACNLCQRALRVVTDPWSHPVVIKIINDVPISESEGRDFFLTEMPILLTSRLDRKSFQDSRCLLEPVCSVVCQQLWIDLHVTLVYICNEKDDFVVMLERHFSDGHDIVNRLIRRTSESYPKTKENSGINRIWREHGMETADVASQCLLSTALIRCPPPDSLSPLAIQFVNLQKAIGKSTQDIISKLHKLIYNDQLEKIMTPAHMYVLGATLSDTFRNDFKPFGVELYVKAVAADLNILESQKLNQDGEGIRIAEIGLAVAFSKLAEFLHANLRICREIALTAFSLHPTKERFDILVELVVEQTAKEKSESATEKLHPSTSIKSSNGIGEKELGIPITVPQEEESQLPYSDSDATALGLSEAVIRDLASIVHSVRWDVLTWKNGWKELEPLCRRYMVDQENMRSVTKELLFLKVDYNQFKDMPRLEHDENWGIEKGYEKCLPTARIRKHSRCKRKLKRKPQLRAKIGLLAKKKSLMSRSLSRGRSKQITVTKRKILMHPVTQSIMSSSPPPPPDVEVDSWECIGNPELGLVPEGVKRSARIKTRKLRNARQESFSLVKRLREIRLKPEDMHQGRALCRPIQTSDWLEVHRKSKELYCPRFSYVNDEDYFAPMLSTLDMQPRVILTRISISMKELSISKPNCKINVNTTEDSANYKLWEESDIDEFNSARKMTMINETNLNSIQSIDHSLADVMQLKILTENDLQESTRGIDSSNQNSNMDSGVHQVLQEQDPSSSTIYPLLSWHGKPDDAARGDMDSTLFTSLPDFAINDTDPDPLLLSPPPLISITQASHQSEKDDCSAVLQLDTDELASVNPRLRRRFVSHPFSVYLDDPSFCTPSHTSVEFPHEDYMDARPPVSQQDHKRRKMEPKNPTSTIDGTGIASDKDPHPLQLDKQGGRQWCSDCGFPRSGGNQKDCRSPNEPNSLPHKSSDNQEHRPEDCKKIQASNQGLLAWIKWLQLELIPEGSPHNADITEYERAQDEANSSLLEDLNLLIAQLCDKSQDTRVAQVMACDYLQSYCRARQQSISLPLPPNNVSQLNLLDWFRLLIFQPEDLSRQTTYVNVLAFLISLLIEERPTPGILNRIDGTKCNAENDKHIGTGNMAEKEDS